MIKIEPVSFSNVLLYDACVAEPPVMLQHRLPDVKAKNYFPSPPIPGLSKNKKTQGPFLLPNILHIE